MNDKELADKVVALELDGLHGRYAHKAGNREWFTYARDMEAKEFVRDWRVAGSLMEKVDWAGANIDIEKWSTGYEVAIDGSIYREDESLPRAIIAACTEALVESKCLRIKRSGLS